MPSPRRLSLLLSGLLSVGCRVDADTFSAELPVSACDYADLCEGTLAAEDACEDGFSSAVAALVADETCTYDANQAWQCLRTLDADADACDEKTAVYYECKRVFQGEDCELDLLETMF